MYDAEENSLVEHTLKRKMERHIITTDAKKVDAVKEINQQKKL